MIEKEVLEKLYVKKKKSVAEISHLTSWSQTAVNYWLFEHGIPKRSISEAIYVKRNPKGDPFVVERPKSIDQAVLYGLGLGLYWGEGNKKNKMSIKLGNTDPKLVKKFIAFMEQSFKIERKKLRFGLQVFSDMSKTRVLNFWVKELSFPRTQFQQVVITKSRGMGTYKNKTQYGVLTVYYNNKKLRDILCQTIEKL